MQVCDSFTEASHGPHAGSPPAAKLASYATKLNANAASAKRTRSAGTVSAALEYRRQQQALAETAAISAAADTAAGAAAAAVAEAAADADDAGREAVRVATADLKQLHLGSMQQQPTPPRQNGHSKGGSNHVQQSVLNGTNGAVPTTNRVLDKQSEASYHTAEVRADNIYKTADEAASDSKAFVSTTSGSTLLNNSRRSMSGSNGTATTSSPASSWDSTTASSGRQSGGTSSVKADKSVQQDVRRKHIPVPRPNTSPRIKSALLAAEEYRKQKAARTAALALAAASAAASSD